MSLNSQPWTANPKTRFKRERSASYYRSAGLSKYLNSALPKMYFQWLIIRLKRQLSSRPPCRFQSKPTPLRETAQDDTRMWLAQVRVSPQSYGGSYAKKQGDGYSAMNRKGGCHPGRSHGSMASQDTRVRAFKGGGRIRGFLSSRGTGTRAAFAASWGTDRYLPVQNQEPASQFLYSLGSLVTVLERLSIVPLIPPDSSVGKGF